MTVRRTVSLPDDLDRAVAAVAGENFSGFAQRALRNALVARELELIAAHAVPTVDSDVATTVDCDADTELADQERGTGRE